MSENKSRKIKNDIIEYDDNGNIIGHGTHADYDFNAVQVQNGEGYYDSNGHYCEYDSDDW